MDIIIISKTKYRWEYLYVPVPLIILAFFPSMYSPSWVYIFTGCVIVLFLFENQGYIGYKKLGELKISYDKIIVEMKKHPSKEIILNDSHKIYTFISQDFNVKYKAIFIYKFFVFVNEKAIVNVDLRVSKKTAALFNHHLEVWRERNNLLVNVVTK